MHRLSCSQHPVAASCHPMAALQTLNSSLQERRKRTIMTSCPNTSLCSQRWGATAHYCHHNHRLEHRLSGVVPSYHCLSCSLLLVASPSLLFNVKEGRETIASLLQHDATADLLVPTALLNASQLLLLLKIAAKKLNDELERQGTFCKSAFHFYSCTTRCYVLVILCAAVDRSLQ